MGTYKDDLAAAHARIEALEQELAGLKGAGRPRGDPPRRPRANGAALALVVLGVLAGASLMALAVLGRTRVLPLALGYALGFGVLAWNLGRLVVVPANAVLVLRRAAGAGRRAIGRGRTVRRPGERVEAIMRHPVVVRERACVVWAAIAVDAVRLERAVEALVGRGRAAVEVAVQQALARAVTKAADATALEQALVRELADVGLELVHLQHAATAESTTDAGRAMPDGANA